MAQESEKKSDLEKGKMEFEDEREKLIGAAVTFLQNPKVRESPFEQRRKFLEKKGLSKTEIEAAIATSGTSMDLMKQSAETRVALLPTTDSLKIVSPNTLAGFRDLVASAMMVTGIGYTIYRLLRFYLGESVFGPTEEKRRTEQIDAVRESVTLLETSVCQTAALMRDVQNALSRQQEGFAKLLDQGARPPRGEGEIVAAVDSRLNADIRDEIKSLKSLLLSRGQFPAPPPPSVVTTPTLPSWQLRSSTLSASSATTDTSFADTTADSTLGKDSELSIENSEVNGMIDGSTTTVVSEKLEVSGESLPA